MEVSFFAGLPLAPGQLEVVGDTPYQLNISWSPPFALLGEIVPYYLVIVDLQGRSQDLFEGGAHAPPSPVPSARRARETGRLRQTTSLARGLASETTRLPL